MFDVCFPSSKITYIFHYLLQLKEKKKRGIKKQHLGDTLLLMQALS